jgi:epoxide hydrolase-like predicted phosphatase
MSRIEAVISDFGGVLTSPMLDSFLKFQEASGIPVEAFGQAIAAVAARDGANPLFELETGRITERRFQHLLSEEMTSELGRKVELHSFGEQYLSNLHPNQALIDYLRGLRERHYKLAICTNNVREWEQLWRAKLPVDDIFDVVVDSAFVGTRKPEPKIYEITLQRLGVAAPAAVFVDDLEHNVIAARDLGMTAIWFRSTEQTIEEIEAALSSD